MLDFLRILKVNDEIFFAREGVWKVSRRIVSLARVASSESIVAGVLMLLVSTVGDRVGDRVCSRACSIGFVRVVEKDDISLKWQPSDEYYWSSIGIDQI